ncbi:hypothetical protein BJX63DRAFT_397842 [Aspergillus granulosus]|uniref:Uncharacterized protein n=1 Tax=Aspergillus granulosus TaxID=176169 RepID=A0ABR4H964_9EURO
MVSIKISLFKPSRNRTPPPSYELATSPAEPKPEDPGESETQAGPTFRKRDCIRNTFEKAARKCQPILHKLKNPLLMIGAIAGGFLGAVVAVCVEIVARAALLAWDVINAVVGAVCCILCCPFVAVGAVVG